MKPNKKYTFILFSLVLLATSAKAKQKDIENPNIDIFVQQLTVQGDSLTIDLMIEAKDLKINTGQSLQLDIVIEDSTHRAFLPYVLYSGKQRLLFDQRKEIVSHTINKMDPYHTFKGIDRKKSYPLHYKLTIPYNQWMDQASVYVKQVYHDCCNQWLIKNEVLIVGLSPKKTVKGIITQSDIWAPDSTICRQMLQFITPEKEQIKNRMAFVSANLSYPVNVYKVLPDFKNNSAELLRVDSLIKNVINNELINISAFYITGYASPEGTYKSNDLLAKRRSIGFKNYIVQNTIIKTPIANSWVAEDWNGLVKLIKNREMSYREEVLNIINTIDIFDGRETKLMQLAGGNPYKEMLAELFPQLRRIELRADYVVKTIADNRAEDLIYTRPELLSLEEIYRVANKYAPATKDHQLVYEVAAKTYPNDAVANNNAAAACLMNNDTVSALIYLDKLGDSNIGHLNRAAYACRMGNIDLTEKYLRLALNSEDTRQQAEIGLLLLNNISK